MSELLAQVRNPVSLIGLALMLMFSVHRAMIKSGIIPPLDRRVGGRLAFAILRYGFAICVLIILAGIFLAWRDIIPSAAAKPFKRSLEENSDVVRLYNFLEKNTGRLVYLDFAISREFISNEYTPVSDAIINLPDLAPDECSFWSFFVYPREKQFGFWHPEQKIYSFDDLLCIRIGDPDNSYQKYLLGEQSPHDYLLYGSHGDIVVQGFFTIAGRDFRDSLGFTFLIFPVDRLAGADRLA